MIYMQHKMIRIYMYVNASQYLWALGNDLQFIHLTCM